MSPTRGSGARLSRTVSTHFRRRLAVTDCPYSPRGKTTQRSCRVGHRRRATARLRVSPRTAAAQGRAARWPTKWRNSRTSRIWVRLRCSLAHLLALCSSCVYVCANRNHHYCLPCEKAAVLCDVCCLLCAVCCLLRCCLRTIPAVAMATMKMMQDLTRSPTPPTPQSDASLAAASAGSVTCVPLHHPLPIYYG
jgi:hypothetical protein